MKGMKRWGLRRLGGKRGFTLIELLIVMVILAILAGIVIISIGGVFGTAQERAYEAATDQIQVAVGDYMSRELGELPVTGDTVEIGTGNYSIIDMCILQMSYSGNVSTPGLLLEIPVSCIDTGTDNCGATTCSFISPDAGDCDIESHYVWAVTAEGDVKSACVGSVPDVCDANDTNGFQGIYP